MERPTQGRARLRHALEDLARVSVADIQNQLASVLLACSDMYASENPAVSIPNKTRAKPVKLRAMEFKDHEQIVRLEAAHGIEPRNYGSWLHFWQGNPAYRNLNGEWTIGWVAEDEDHRIVASVANIPLSYEFDGKRILANTGRALVAEPKHRSACLMLLDRLINKTEADLYLNNTVGTTSSQLVELFECPRVPVGSWDRKALWVTGYKRVSERLLELYHVRPRKMLGCALAGGIYVWDHIRSRGVRAHDIDVLGCDSFDHRFDTFWEDLRRKRRHHLLAVRSTEVLNWHFEHAALDKRLWVATVLEGSHMTAYAIFERRDTGGYYSGLTRIRLVDFQSLDGEMDMLPPFLVWALKRCRKEGIDILEVGGSWLEKGELVGVHAPHRRKLPTWTYYYRAKSQELARVLEDRRSWSPTLFDGDATL